MLSSLAFKSPLKWLRCTNTCPHRWHSNRHFCNSIHLQNTAKRTRPRMYLRQVLCPWTAFATRATPPSRHRPQTLRVLRPQSPTILADSTKASRLRFIATLCTLHPRTGTQQEFQNVAAVIGTHLRTHARTHASGTPAPLPALSRTWPENQATSKCWQQSSHLLGHERAVAIARLRF